GVRVEKAQPLETGERSECVEEICKLHAAAEFCIGREILAVACSVLADECDLAHTLRDKLLCFGDDARNGARAELATKLWNDAEAAGMIAAFGNLDVGRC